MESFNNLANTISPKFTEQVLLDIIKKKSDLSDVQVTEIKTDGSSTKKGDSYLSTICRFTVEIVGQNKGGDEETASIPIIVKYLPENIARRKTFRSTDFFENEILFYEKVVPAFENFQNSKNIQNKFDNLPELVSAYIDGENDYVAMLDLSYEGYTDTNRSADLNCEYTTAILQLLASFHALSLAFKDQEPEAFEEAALSLKETYFTEKYRSWYMSFQQKVFAVGRDCVEKELPPSYLEKYNKFISRDVLKEMYKICSERGPLSVVNHGDVWAPNFLIKYDSQDQTKLEKIKMIDFQLARYATLATDITFFLYSCVDFDLIDKKWDDIIGVYYKALIENLERFGSSRNLVTLESLNHEIKKNMIFGLAIGIEAVTMALLEDDEVSDFDIIQGTEAVPIETVWLVHPFKDQEKRRRIAKMIKHAIDNNFI